MAELDKTRLKCCAVLCALNEAGRIERVIATAIQSGLFSEVLVVDDGSSDGTAVAAEAAGARVLRHHRNKGKSAAMLTGLQATTEPVICYLDADLLGVSVEHLRMLVEPVTGGEYPATLGVFEGGRRATSMAQKVAPMISGQRCLRRELLEGFEGWTSGFGVETALNDHLQRLGVAQHIVRWQGAGQVMKEEKRGVLRGFAARLKMYAQIIAAWSRARLRR